MPIICFISLLPWQLQPLALEWNDSRCLPLVSMEMVATPSMYFCIFCTACHDHYSFTCAFFCSQTFESELLVLTQIFQQYLICLDRQAVMVLKAAGCCSWTTCVYAFSLKRMSWTRRRTWTSWWRTQIGLRTGLVDRKTFPPSKSDLGKHQPSVPKRSCSAACLCRESK